MKKCLGTLKIENLQYTAMTIDEFSEDVLVMPPIIARYVRSNQRSSPSAPQKAPDHPGFPPPASRALKVFLYTRYLEGQNCP